jgi:type VI secretion system secreted protein Hcp
MTTKSAIENRIQIRILDEAELDVVNGGSIFDVFIEALNHTITSPRDAASGLPTGKRMHKPIVL